MKVAGEQSEDDVTDIFGRFDEPSKVAFLGKKGRKWKRYFDD